jgi:hypothetical protein
VTFSITSLKIDQPTHLARKSEYRAARNGGQTRARGSKKEQKRRAKKDTHFGCAHFGCEYFVFYKVERPHQALGYRTPELVHRSGNGGGAVIADHFGSAGQGDAIHLTSEA